MDLEGQIRLYPDDRWTTQEILKRYQTVQALTTITITRVTVIPELSSVVSPTFYFYLPLLFAVPVSD